MTSPETDIAVLRAELIALRERVTALEANQKWGVITLLGLGAKAITDLMAGWPR